MRQIMGAAIASTAVRRRDVIERVSKLAGAELSVCQRAVSRLDDARRNDSAAKPAAAFASLNRAT